MPSKGSLNFFMFHWEWLNMKPCQNQLQMAWAMGLKRSMACMAIVVWSTAVQADNEALKQLMQANNCSACHMIDKRKYGPQFNEIAGKYAGDAKAVATLAAKIKAGGTGVWGEDIMPPQPQVSDADAKTLAEWILALPPGAPK